MCSVLPVRRSALRKLFVALAAAGRKLVKWKEPLPSLWNGSLFEASPCWCAPDKRKLFCTG